MTNKELNLRCSQILSILDKFEGSLRKSFKKHAIKALLQNVLKGRNIFTNLKWIIKIKYYERDTKKILPK